MLPGPAQLYACPHCGKKKAMFTMLSCNTSGATLWSDGRSIYPMRPTLSFIQRCESCNSYSLLSEWKERGYDKDNYNGTTGNLTYEEIKEAYIILTASGRYDSEEILSISLEYIRSYNDQFRRTENSAEENDDLALFMNASDEAIKLLGNDSDSLITKAELYRERGEFKSARELLLTAYNKSNSWVVEPMLYFCNRFDKTLFPLIKYGQKIDWSQTSNYQSTVKGELVGIREKIKEEAVAFISTLHGKRREKIDTQSDGGIYENSGRTLLRILDNCPAHYEISRGTEHIAEYAAYLNFHLKSVDFPSSIRSIGARAFWGCKNLQGYSYDAFGSQIISIGDEAFMNCKKIESFSSIFLKHIRFIGRGAFSGMDNLKEIDLPNGLLEIPAFCFGCDDSLTSVDIPKSVSTIGEGAFFCSGITEILLPDSVKNLGDFIFSTCKKLKRVQLPKYIKRIPLRTFSFCESLTHIDVPSKVKSIGERAFEGTSALKSIRFRGKVNVVHPSVFKDSPIATIYVPWYLYRYYKRLFPNISVKCKIK